MDYMTRPVLLQAIDWARQPAQSFSYELRSHQLGFGWPRFAPEQLHVVNGWQVSLWLQEEADVVAMDQFLDQLRGPLNGFWFPDPHAAGVIEAIPSTTQIDLANSRARDTWQLHPALVLIFTKTGQTPQIATITDVSLAGDLERVTVDASLAIDLTWTMRRLRFVRLAGEEETATVDAEGRQTVALRVVELPTEYAAIQSGAQPVYLYHFYADLAGTLVHWRFTSYWETVTSQTVDHIPKAITHGALSQSTKGDRETATIDAFYEADHPLALFVPFTLPVPLYVEIYSTTFPNPNDVALLFAGQIDEADVKGSRVVARCNSFLDSLTRKLPSWPIQPRCPYQTYDQRTCKLDRADWEETADLEAIAGRTVRVHNLAADQAANYFAWGLLETGTGADYEARTILADARVDADTHDLLLNQPLLRAELAQAVTILPGDDHRALTCQTKFDNFVNFGGHPFVPQRNLTIQAIQPEPGGGGKK